MNEPTPKKTPPAGDQSERQKKESGNTNNLPQSQPFANEEIKRRLSVRS